MTETQNVRPLEGVRVLELGSLIAGPFAGRVFADFGAEVLKVESPTSADPMRDWGKARVNGRALWWSVQSRGKKLIGVDLKSPQGREIIDDLVRGSDVLIENFRPGTLEKFGLSPQHLWSINPGLVIARISGYGQTGSNAHKAGYASVAEAAGGLRHLNGYPGTPPPRSGISLGDSLAALYAVQGIMMALYWRDVRGGTGQIVDISLVESCFSLLESAVPDYAATQHIAQASGSKLTGIAPSNIYLSSDGKWVVIAANQNSVFARLAAAMHKQELVTDPRFVDHVARGEHQEEIDDIISAWAATRSILEITTVLDANGVPTSGVNSIEDIFADPLFRERDMLIEVPDDELGSVTHPGIIPKLSASPGRILWNGPSTVGKQTREVLTDRLNLSKQDVDELMMKGVIK